MVYERRATLSLVIIVTQMAVNASQPPSPLLVADIHREARAVTEQTRVQQPAPRLREKHAQEDLIEIVKASARIREQYLNRILSSITKLVLNDGVDVNKIDSQGHTALFYAIMLNKRPLVELLVQLGADVERVHAEPLIQSYLKKGNYAQLLPYLTNPQRFSDEEKNARKDRLDRLVGQQFAERRKRAFKEVRPDAFSLSEAVEMQDRYSVTVFLREQELTNEIFSLALRKLSQIPSGYNEVQLRDYKEMAKEIIFELLRNKPDILCSRNGSGQTPLIEAVTYNLSDIVEQFIARPVDLQHYVNAIDNEGLTALNYARRMGLQEIASLLERKGGRVNDPVPAPVLVNQNEQLHPVLLTLPHATFPRAESRITTGEKGFSLFSFLVAAFGMFLYKSHQLPKLHKDDNESVIIENDGSTFIPAAA